LYRDAGGRYRIDLRWRAPDGSKGRFKEVLPPGTTAGAAKLRAQGVLSAALAGTLTRAADAPPATLGAAFDCYLEWCDTNRSGRGDPLYKKRHKAHWVATLGAGFALVSLTSEAPIERHKKRRRDAGKGPGTINRELVTIKHFLAKCVEWTWLPKAPKVYLLEEPPPRVRWLSEDERAKLSKALSGKQRAPFRRLVCCALLSGVRLGNLVQLRKAQVDLVRRTLTLVLTKRGDRHHVPISDELATVLGEAMASSSGEFVFVTQRRPKPYTRSGASTFFARIAAEAGLEDFHFHDLRHTFATEVLRGGNGLNVVQALLGHASPAMTQRYAHLGRDDLQRAVGAVVPIAPALPPAPQGQPRERQKKRSARDAQRAS